jgi:hypothetical protein
MVVVYEITALRMDTILYALHLHTLNNIQILCTILYRFILFLHVLLCALHVLSLNPQQIGLKTIARRFNLLQTLQVNLKRDRYSIIVVVFTSKHFSAKHYSDIIQYV